MNEAQLSGGAEFALPHGSRSLLPPAAAGPRPGRMLGSLLLTLGALWGCVPDREPIVLGVVGSWNTTDMGARQAVETAVREINARGGVRGRQLEVRVRDDGFGAERAVRIAQEFVADRSVVAVIGHSHSNPTLAASQIYDGHLAAISPTATSPELAGASRWLFRLSPDDARAGATLARFANVRGLRRAVVLYSNTSNGAASAAAFQRHFRGEIVGIDPILPQKTTPADVEPFITHYRRKRPDVVYIGGFATTGEAVLREIRRQGLEVEVLTEEIPINRMADDRLPANLYFVSRRMGRGPGLQRFETAFIQQHGRPPSIYASLAYEAVMLLTQAMERAGTHRKAIRDYLDALDANHPGHGVAGPVWFDAAGGPAARNLSVCNSAGTCISARDF
ncbi:MAG TPA: ABC transporter substrate-binding protein [Longimicrobiaceae bacterium]|nr:ABC transporter substrate-binding protein [Longimicrobiaceae bacterium]